VIFILGDTLVRIQNSLVLKEKYVKVFRNKLILDVVNLLYINGFINGYFFVKNDPFYIYIVLKYINSQSVFQKFQIFSKPSKSIYCSKKIIQNKIKNKGFIVISTSYHGLVITNYNLINYNKIICGGKLLFKIVL
jgi:ribosomal protein S8